MLNQRVGILKQLLTHPLTRGLSIDDPQTTVLRRSIIQSKPFLDRIYREWYAALLLALPATAGEVVEIGSGGGFFKEIFPDIITSETFYCPGIGLVVNAHYLPFSDHSLRGIVMTDVLHHMTHPRRFFAEATRCVCPGGVIAMIEPWVNSWSTLIYTRFHHEPFIPDAAEWELPEDGGPLSTANGAMPWIIFHRDRARFEEEFPEWKICDIEPFMPLRYLLSGGVSMRNLMPGWSFAAWKTIESPFHRVAGMFAKIILQRR